jgi:hypothetical protein
VGHTVDDVGRTLGDEGLTVDDVCRTLGDVGHTVDDVGRTLGNLGFTFGGVMELQCQWCTDEITQLKHVLIISQAPNQANITHEAPL